MKQLDKVARHDIALAFADLNVDMLRRILQIVKWKFAIDVVASLKLQLRVLVLGR